jgi:hypothetical protein
MGFGAVGDRIGKRAAVPGGRSMRAHRPEDYFRAVRTCNEVLHALGQYDDRDDAIERLELEIRDDRLEALLGAREFDSRPVFAP